MLIYELVEKCNMRNESKIIQKQCEGCTYGDECPHDCKKCLEYVHFPNRAPEMRHYDCVHMADCYYCKYSFRYASEIVYGLKQFADIRKKDNLRVMSVGCGPCTELAAIDYLRHQNYLNYKGLEFLGIDPLDEVWVNIWGDIKKYFGGGIYFLNKNMLEIVDVIIEKQWVPDLIIFQYVFSDMYKNHKQEDIENFIEKLAAFLDGQIGKSIYILANDTNLSIQYSGGREFFDILRNKIRMPKIIREYHFDNMNREKHYEYGEEYRRNDLVFDNIPDEIHELYEPFESCTSAQLLIKKT